MNPVEPSHSDPFSDTRLTALQNSVTPSRHCPRMKSWPT